MQKLLKITMIKLHVMTVFFHGKYVNLCANDIDLFNSNDQIWRCDPCASTISMILEAGQGTPAYIYLI